MRKIVWMFSGQGSQYFNMGRGLYESDPVFRDVMNRCDEVVRRLRGESLLDVIYRPNDKDRFTDFVELRHTHPALFAVQYSLAQTLLHRGMKPDLLLGYSLGEIVAAAVGGALPMEAALESLLDQARLLTASAEPGAMLALLASPEIWSPRDPLYAETWVAARNAPQHFVLSGPPAAIDRIQQLAREYNAQAIVVGLPLNMDDTEGPQARLSRTWAVQLAAVCGLEVRLWDERLSSFTADQALAGRYTRKQKKARQDAYAAAAILQDFLNSSGPEKAMKWDEGERKA